MQHLQPSAAPTSGVGPSFRDLLGLLALAGLVSVAFGGGAVAGALHAMGSDASEPPTVATLPAPRIPLVEEEVMVDVVEPSTSSPTVTIAEHSLGESDPSDHVDEALGVSLNLW